MKYLFKFLINLDQDLKIDHHIEKNIHQDLLKNIKNINNKIIMTKMFQFNMKIKLKDRKIKNIDIDTYQDLKKKIVNLIMKNKLTMKINLINRNQNIKINREVDQDHQVIKIIKTKYKNLIVLKREFQNLNLKIIIKKDKK